LALALIKIIPAQRLLYYTADGDEKTAARIRKAVSEREKGINSCCGGEMRRSIAAIRLLLSIPAAAAATSDNPYFAPFNSRVKTTTSPREAVNLHEAL